MTPTIIAIDGPAASGKSSVGRLLAKKLSFLFVSSGAYYRTLAWSAAQASLDLTNETAVEQWLAGVVLKASTVNGTFKLLLGEEDVSAHYSDPEVTAFVSPLAALPAVRSFLLEQLRALGKEHNLIMEGRDIGSVVFPETPFKFYITASLEERMRRRHQEGTADAIAERDQRDANRATAPLVIPEGAVVIDTTHLSLEEVIAQIESSLVS